MAEPSVAAAVPPPTAATQSVGAPPPGSGASSQAQERPNAVSSLLQLKFEERVIAASALVLFIALTMLPWFEISAGPLSWGAAATEAPDGWLGVLAVLAAVALLAYMLAEKLAPDLQVPVIGGSRATTQLLMAAVAAGLVALKFIFHVHFSLFGFGFYLAVVAAGLLVAFAVLARQKEDLSGH